jgi:hypothetical protein
LLILLNHCAFANGGLHHESASSRLGGSAEGGRVLSPSARLDAEDGKVDWISTYGDDTILGDDAVLLASGDDFAGEQKQRLGGVIDEDQCVDLVAAVLGRLGTGRRGTAGTNESLDAACLSNFDIAAADAFIEGNEGSFAGGFVFSPDNGK